MRVYTLREPDGPWGVLGSTLMSGLSPERVDGRLQIERTGPYVPAVFLPGLVNVVVTGSLRSELQVSGLTGFQLRPAAKKHVSYIPWGMWENEDDEPPEWEWDDPEQYVLRRPHSPEFAASMDSLWELVIRPTASVGWVRTGPESYDNNPYLLLSSWGGQDFFRAERGLHLGFTWVSRAAMEWLEEQAPGCLGFEPALTDRDLAGVVRWTPPPPLDEELKELLVQGKLISAILRYQQEKGGSLKDARAYVEMLAQP